MAGRRHGSGISFTPVSGGKCVVGNSGITLLVGEFPDYFDLRANIVVTRFSSSGDETGKVVRLRLTYKTKEKVGIEDKVYELGTFVGRY